MDKLAEGTASWAVPLNFDDVQDFTDHIRPWNLDFTQVRRGHFRSSGFLLSLGAMTLGYVRLNQALIQRVSVPAGYRSLFTVSRDSDATFLGQQALRVGDCSTVPGDYEFEAISRGQITGFGIGFDDPTWQGSGEWLAPLPKEVPGEGLRIRSFGEAWAETFYSLIEDVLDDAAAGFLDSLAAREEHAERILLHIRSAQSADDGEPTTHRARARRRAAVLRAREFINARLSEPIRLAQVCRYACAQSRTLEYGFREMFDIPMVGYIKALRMDRVRKLLRSPDQRHRTVSELAMDTGFWHLSQFASDYKKFFGESPSQTHRRAGGATGPRWIGNA